MDFLNNINLNQNELQNVRLQNLETEPEAPVTGQIYFDTVDKTVYVWIGDEWKNVLDEYTGETLTAEMKQKLEGIADQATKSEASALNGYVKINGENVRVYIHPGGTGNRHIPSGGSSGQILTWSADGMADWEDPGTSGTQVLTQSNQPSGHLSGRCWIKTY